MIRVISGVIAATIALTLGISLNYYIQVKTDKLDTKIEMLKERNLKAETAAVELQKELLILQAEYDKLLEYSKVLQDLEK